VYDVSPESPRFFRGAAVASGANDLSSTCPPNPKPCRVAPDPSGKHPSNQHPVGLSRTRLCASGHVATIDQLIDMGASRGQLGRAVAHGRLLHLRRGVYACPHGAPDLEAAARLGGALTCVTVVRSAGVWAGRSRLLHLMVPPNSSGRGARDRRTRVRTTQTISHSCAGRGSLSACTRPAARRNWQDGERKRLERRALWITARHVLDDWPDTLTAIERALCDSRPVRPGGFLRDTPPIRTA